MHTFQDGDGNDSTTAALAWLASHDRPLFRDLLLIGEAEDSAALWLTNDESDLVWSWLGTFHAVAGWTREKVPSKIGLDVLKMNLSFSPRDQTLGATLATANIYQRAAAGFYDNWKFRLWRALLPTPGDANTLGATEWFGGYVQKSTVTRGKVTFACDSFLGPLANQKIPPNTIENSNALSGYVAATPVLADGETVLPRFTIVAGSSSTVLLATCSGPIPGKIYGQNKLALGYVVFDKSSSLPGAWSAIATNVKVKVAGVYYNQFQLFGRLASDPEPGDTFYAATQLDVAGDDAAFLYVPAPEEAF